jgi:hypothetical protein
MSINLFRYTYKEDYGHSWNFQFLNCSKHTPKLIKRRSLLQVCFSWCDQPTMLYFQVSGQPSCPLSVLIWGYKFGIDVDLCAYTWKFESLPGTSRV